MGSELQQNREKAAAKKALEAEKKKKRVAKPKKAVAPEPLPEPLPDVKGETFDKAVAKECQRIFRMKGNDELIWFRDFWLAARVSVPGVLDIMTEEKDRIDIVLGSAVSQGLIVQTGPGRFPDGVYVWTERARTLWKTVPAPELPKEAWRLKAEADNAHAAARIAVVDLVRKVYACDPNKSATFDSSWLRNAARRLLGEGELLPVSESTAFFHHAEAAGLVVGSGYEIRWNHKAFKKNEAPQEKETTMNEDERYAAFILDLLKAAWLSDGFREGFKDEGTIVAVFDKCYAAESDKPFPKGNWSTWTTIIQAVKKTGLIDGASERGFVWNEPEAVKAFGPRTTSPDRKERVRAFLSDFWHGKVKRAIPGFNGTWIANQYLSLNSAHEPPPWNHHREVKRIALETGLVRALGGGENTPWAWNEPEAEKAFGPRAAPAVVETKELTVAHPAPNTDMTDKEQVARFASWLLANTSLDEQIHGWTNADVFHRYTQWTSYVKVALLSFAGFEKAAEGCSLLFRGAKGQWFASDKANAALAEALPKVQAFGEKWALWNAYRDTSGRWILFDSEADAKQEAALYPDTYGGHVPVRVGELGKGQVGEHVRQEAIAFSLANQALSEQKTKLSTENKRLDTEARAARTAYQELLVTHDEALLLIAKEKPKAASVWEKKEDRYAAGLLDAYETIEDLLAEKPAGGKLTP